MEQEIRWIRAVQRSGSREAADCLIRAYYDEIYRFVYRQVGSREDAMDLTQTIFMAMLRSLPSYDAGRAAFRTWLYRVAANKVIDARRRSGPAAVPLEEAAPAVQEDFTGRVRDRELLRQIEGYVRALDPALQTIFRLRIYAEAPFPEIAAVTGQPESKIKAQYYRLQGRLRKEFGKDV